MHRRQFFKTVAGATAGMYIAGRGGAASARQASPARRQAMIGGRRVRVIDVHTHWDMPVPASIVKGTPFEARANGASIDERIAIMDRLGIDVDVISVNDFWWWDTNDRGLARAICDHHNATLAKTARDYPGRFYGMASVPLQFPDLAVEMLQAAVKTGRAASRWVVTSAARACRRRGSTRSGPRRPSWACSSSCTRTARPTSSRTAAWQAAAGWATSSATRSRRRSSSRA